MTIEEMKSRLEKVNKELEELQLEGMDIVLVQEGDARDAMSGRASFIQVVKGRLHL